MSAALCAIIGAALAWLLTAILTAPEGYEDATGFRLGREPVDDAGREPADRLASPLSAPFHNAGVPHG